MDISEIAEGEDHSRTVLLEGEIIGGDADRLLEVLRDDGPDDKHVTLMLNSPGGNILEADKLAGTIRQRALAVKVLDGQMCASACFLLFAASRDRSASPGAMIGVHSASLFGDENLVTVGVTTLMAREASAFDVPPEIIGRMVTTEPSKMAWLTDAELKEMNVRILRTQPSLERVRKDSHTDVIAGGFAGDKLNKPSLIAPEPALPTESVSVMGTIFVYKPAEFAIGPSGGNSSGKAQPILKSLEADHFTNVISGPVYVAVGPKPNSMAIYVPGIDQ